MKLSRKNAGVNTAGRPSMFESLETRQLMAAQINYTDFSSTTGLSLNGFNTTSISANRIQLTSGVNTQSRSVFYQTKEPISQFKTDFTFRASAGALTADGLTFTIQNDPRNDAATGYAGKYLGYSGITNSASAAFNFYNYTAEGQKFGFAKNGQVPPDDIDMAPLDLHAGHLIHAQVSYDGHVMRVLAYDATDKTKRFSSAKVMDLQTIVGGDTAYVGFTASTGVRNSYQWLSSWTYTGSNGPDVTGSADPSPVTGTSTTLSASSANDTGHGATTYNWVDISRPAGAKGVNFATINGEADSVSATFSKDGTYQFRVTGTDQDGFVGSDLVTVVVQQTATTIGVNPHKVSIANGATEQYSGKVYDQFNRLMRAQPTLTFSATGPGTINASTGLFTASKTAVGHVVITASLDDLSGVAGATVLPV